jgi:uncharacterized membrane protein
MGRTTGQVVDMPRGARSPGQVRRAWSGWRAELALAVGVGVVSAGGLGIVASLPIALLSGWDIATLAYLGLVWADVWRMSAEQTETRASVTDPARPVADLLLLVAAVASLVAVGFVLVRAGQAQGTEELLRIGLGLASVVLSWALVHTIFALRYASLYYHDGDGGIDFNDPEPPSYGDFAYLAFTIGMTFQVSDTALRAAAIRRTALRHALLSYLFGTGILAATINLVASLSSR